MESPSDLELQVLAIVWERGEVSVRDVLENLPDGRPRAYTTVLSVLQTMEKKGLVASRREGKANLYRALVEQERLLGSLLRRMVRQVFGGRPAAMMECLLGESRVSREELAELREIIESHSQNVTTETDEGATAARSKQRKTRGNGGA